MLWIFRSKFKNIQSYRAEVSKVFGVLVLNSEKCCCIYVVCRCFVLSLFCVVISLFVICFHRCWGVLGVCHLYLHLRRLRRGLCICCLYNLFKPDPHNDITNPPQQPKQQKDNNIMKPNDI